MARLRKQITAMAPARAAMRKTRQRNKVPMVAIAGYTNAGKSSILNRITRAGVLVENALFATLDPTVRKHQTEDGREYTLADTVGFVENLPHQLVEAFRSTLEEIAEADLIVIVVDGSNPQPMKQLNTVRSVMAETGISGIEQLVVFNKRDLIPFDVEVELANQVEGCMFVSAKTGAGIEQLEERIANLLPRPEVEFKGLIPYHRGDLISRIHLSGELLGSEYQEHGTMIHALVEHALASELEQARI
jgi:GTP-binding protein HflX